MKTLAVVMAHKAAQETFNRHFHLWRKLENTDLMVACPSDSKVILPERGKAIAYEVGKAEHTGRQSIVRMRTILEQMNHTGYERYVFFEYDSFCLGQLPEPQADIMANCFFDHSPNRGFEGTMFCHPPLLFTVKGLADLVQSIQTLPLTAEAGVWDRWLGWAMQRANLNVFDLIKNKLGTSRNTFHDNELEALKIDIIAGARLIHGIKSPEAFNVCTETYRLMAMKKELQEKGML